MQMPRSGRSIEANDNDAFRARRNVFLRFSSLTRTKIIPSGSTNNTLNDYTKHVINYR